LINATRHKRNDMTIEQCKQSILDKQSQVTQLQKEIADRKAQLIEMSPIKLGDKVMVTTRIYSASKDPYDKQQTGFVKEVELSYKLEFNYKVFEPNKDGTKAGQKRIGFNGTITKI